MFGDNTDFCGTTWGGEINVCTNLSDWHGYAVCERFNEIVHHVGTGKLWERYGKCDECLAVKE